MASTSPASHTCARSSPPTRRGVDAGRTRFRHAYHGAARRYQGGDREGAPQSALVRCTGTRQHTLTEVCPRLLHKVSVSLSPLSRVAGRSQVVESSSYGRRGRSGERGPSTHMTVTRKERQLSWAVIRRSARTDTKRSRGEPAMQRRQGVWTLRTGGQ